MMRAAAGQNTMERASTNLGSKETQSQMGEYLKTAYCQCFKITMNNECKERFRNEQSATKPIQKATAARKRT
jgi:hypothetical protein